MSGQVFIAEVKTRSPFGFLTDYSWHALFDLAVEHGDWVAVHTDPRWGGSFELLEMAADRCDKPVLAKGLHTTPQSITRCFNQGADYVLTTRLPLLTTPSVIYEPTTFENFREVGHSPHRLMWNSRDLSDGKPKEHSIDDALEAQPEKWICQASFIESPEDVNPGADAFIVGSHLPEFIKERSRA